MIVQRLLAARQVDERRERGAAGQAGGAVGRGQGRQLERREPDHPAAGGDQRRPRRGRWSRTAAMTASCLCRAALGRQRVGGAWCGPAARWRTAAPSTGRRRPPAGVAAVSGVPADSSSTVRRGVPCALATSASSVGDRLAAAASRRRGSPAAPRSGAAARPARPPARSGRTWSAGAAAGPGCRSPAGSDRSKTSISRALARRRRRRSRISWMTSSMSRIAMSRPSTRCSRSSRLRSRKAVRRRTTSVRRST